MNNKNNMYDCVINDKFMDNYMFISILTVL